MSTETLTIIEQLKRIASATPGQRFELGEPLGAGGTGVVRTLHDKVLNRRSAVKTLNVPAAENPILTRAFLREAQITSQLGHPTVVPIHDVGVGANGRMYFTMKLASGETLTDRCAALHDPALPVDVAYSQLRDLLDVLLTVCDGLAFAHSRGVVHCDIKPDNILVGDYGVRYIMDWGFARVLPKPDDPAQQAVWVTENLPPLPEGTEAGFVFGSPGFMAPEQATGGVAHLNERTDIFAMGALLYYVMAGRAPFVGASVKETIKLAQTGEYPLIMPTPDGVLGLRPRALIRLVEKAMAKDPAKRFQSIAEFQTALSHYCRGGKPFPVEIVEAGTVIVNQGDLGDCAYIISSGRCEVYKMVNDQRIHLKELGPGEPFGEMSLLNRTDRTASVVALETTTLLVVTTDTLNDEMDSMEPWMGALVRSLAARFRIAQDRHLATVAPPAPKPTDDWELWTRFK